MRLQVWVFLFPLMAIGFAMLARRGLSRHAMCQRNSHGRDAARPSDAASRFLPGFITGVLGSLAMLGAIVCIGRLGASRSATVERPATARVSDAEVEQLLVKVREQSGGTLAEPIPVTVPRETEENLPPPEPEVTALPSTEPPIDGDSLNVTVFELFATEGTQVAELPEWTSRTGTSEGLPRVVTSGLNARPIGAMADAFTRLTSLVSKEFVRKHPEAAGWVPQFSDMYRIRVIGRRAVQRSEVTVGQFTEPMFQEFVEVVPSENLDAQLFKLWRADTVNARLLQVGGGIGLLTLLFGSLAAFLRLSDARRAKSRKPLAAATAALIAAGLALAAMA